MKFALTLASLLISSHSFAYSLKNKTLESFADYAQELNHASNGSIQATTASGPDFEINSRKNVATPVIALPNPDYIQSLFKIDVEKANENFGVKDFASAKKAFYKEQKFKKFSQKFTRPYAYPSDWRSLFHPPIKTLEHPREVYGRQFASLDESIKAESPLFDPELHTKLDALTKTEMTSGNSVSLLSNGQNSFREKIRMVKASKNFFFSAVMVQYCDETGSQMVDALIERAQAGVDVRLVVENVWTRLILKKCLKKLTNGGVKVTLATGFFQRKNLATVMHDKFWIRDGEEAIMGGQNMHDFENHSNGFNGLTRDRDVLIKEGPAVTELIKEFVKLWNYFRKEEDLTLKPYSELANKKTELEKAAGKRGQNLYAQWLTDPVQKTQGLCRVIVQGSQTSRTLISKAYLEIFKNTQHSMLIDTLSLRFKEKQMDDVYNSMLAKLIMDKARAGVKVDLISNGIDADMGETGTKIKKIIEKFQAIGETNMAKVMEEILGVMAAIYSRPNHKAMEAMARTPNIDTWEYFNHIHSKQMVFDHIMTSTGSFNLDQHSYKNHESTLICLDKNLAEESIDGFVTDIANSVPVIAD